MTLHWTKMQSKYEIIQYLKLYGKRSHRDFLNGIATINLYSAADLVYKAFMLHFRIGLTLAWVVLELKCLQTEIALDFLLLRWQSIKQSFFTVSDNFRLRKYCYLLLVSVCEHQFTIILFVRKIVDSDDKLASSINWRLTQCEV